MADLWSMKTEENLNKKILMYQESGTREDYLNLIDIAKKSIKEKSVLGKFEETEQILRRLWSLPQVDASENYLQKILMALDTDLFWKSVQECFQNGNKEDKTGLANVLRRMQPSVIPQLLGKATVIRDVELLHKVVLHLAKKNIDFLLQALQCSDKGICYQSHLVLKKLKDPIFLQKITELKKHPSVDVRKFVIGVLRNYSNPTARLEMMGFLKDEDYSVRKAALEDPRGLADQVNYEDLLVLLEEKINLWKQEEVIKLFQSIIFSNPSKIRKWMDQIFRKVGLFGKKMVDLQKKMFVKSLVTIEEPLFYAITGELLQNLDYQISSENRQILVKYREKRKVKKTAMIEKEAIQKALAEAENKEILAKKKEKKIEKAVHKKKETRLLSKQEYIEALSMSSKEKEKKSNTIISNTSKKTKKAPDLLMKIVREFYKSAPGKFLNILKEFFAFPYEEGDTLDHQRNQLILFLCTAKDKNTLMFLNYLCKGEQFKLPDRLKDKIKVVLKKEGMLF